MKYKQQITCKNTLLKTVNYKVKKLWLMNQKQIVLHQFKTIQHIEKILA